MRTISELNFKELLELTISKALEAKKPNRTLRYLYALGVSLDEKQIGFPTTNHRISLLEILSESLTDIRNLKIDTY